MKKNGDLTPCLAVFTCRGRDRILSEGGSQAWRISSKHVATMDYIVCVQNRNLDWGNASHPHGTAFLIGRISAVQTLPPNSKGIIRKIIKISEYCDLDVPNVWPGDRNPIAYMTLADFGIRLADLEFRLLPVLSEQEAGNESRLEILETPDDTDQDEDAPNDDVLPLTIDQAKRGLASGLGVSIGSIEIVIRA
uniref:Uncharacterized protein n=1 Tax=Polaromonas sp. H1N TaxID=1840283 RepID=A0A2S1FI59_9BURK|nr:hypothetical protein [Polaromonas sp. H1N]AWD72188.1 hypothetical protein pH1NP1_p010 [Polaromonas sp. H1N]